MAERYTRVFAQQGQFYCPSSPVVIEAGALLKDNQTGKIIAQIKFKNISKKAIRALTVKIYAKDVAGADVEGVENFQYLDLNVRRDEEFGAKTPIALPNAVARSFSCECVSAVFSDGTNWECEDDAVWTVLPAPVLLKNEIGAGLAEQYKRDTNSKAEYKVTDHADLWSCTCGATNSMHEGYCHACHAQKTTLLAALNVDVLNANKKKYDDAVAAHQAEIEAKKQRRSKKNKRIAIIASSVIVAVIALVLIVTKVIVPAHDYKEAMNLLESGEYAPAEEAFTKLEGYKDSETMILECRLRKAKEHIMNKEYGQAYTILEALENYSDASDVLFNGKISEANEYIQLGDFKKGYAILNSLGEGGLVNENIYNRAVTALTEKEYDEAYALFSSLKEYKDASEQACEARYQKACAFLSEKKYDKANPIFEGLENYKDSKDKIHYHDYKVTDTKAASCTESGQKTYYCEGCQDKYTEQIKALGHNYKHTATKDATCERQGAYTYTCTRCNDSYTDPIKALGHNYSSATCTKASTCKRCGSQKTAALGHTTTTGVCSRCNYNFTQPLYFEGTTDAKHPITLPYGTYKITLTILSVSSMWPSAYEDTIWADVVDVRGVIVGCSKSKGTCTETHTFGIQDGYIEVSYLWGHAQYELSIEPVN